MIRVGPVLDWRIAMLCGLLWGCALAGLELSVEFGEWPGLRNLANAAIGLIGIWGLTGIGWAGLTRLGEPAARTAVCVALWLSGSFAFTALQVAAFKFTPFARFFAEISNFPTEAIAVHVLWLNAFYGGIYTVGYVVFGRSVRSHRLVSRLQRVLGDEAALASEAGLRSARTQLQPNILIEALAAAKVNYRHRPAAVEAIVEQLIRFLRAASATHADRGASLAKELALAAAYLKLQAALRDRLDGWTVELADPTPALPFPPRLLVPTIERLGQDATTLVLTSGYSADGFVVQLSATRQRAARSGPDPLEVTLSPPLPTALPWTFSSTTIDTAHHWTATAISPAATVSVDHLLHLSATEGITP